MKKLFLALIIVLFTAPSFSNEPQNKVVVYTDVVGDLFHLGHVEFFKRARALGDHLIVGVLEDQVVEEYKRTPILTLEERVRVIAACRYVDEVIIAPPLRLTEELIKKWNISYVVHGDDFSPELLEDQYGTAMRLGILKLLPYTDGISTTNIINRITTRYDAGEFQKK